MIKSYFSRQEPKETNKVNEISSPIKQESSTKTKDPSSSNSPAATQVSSPQHSLPVKIAQDRR